MERKTGEIFEYNGEWYQCIIGHCNQCCFDKAGTCKFIGAPYCAYRNDKKLACFKKLEKVGEPIVIKGKRVQLLKSLTLGNNCSYCCFLDKNKCLVPKEKHLSNTFYVEIKQNKEDMEEYKMHDAKEDIPEFDKVVDECLFGKEKPNLKTFNLEQAKASKPVCTRDGRKARIICFDKQEGFPIIALVETKVNDRISEEIALFNINGRAVSDDIDSKLDLMMSPEKKEGWVNIYRDADNNTPYTENDNIYSSRYKAKESAKMINMKTYIDTIKVEWEE